MQSNRPGLGDATGRRIEDPEGRGYIEWRWAPDYGVEIVNLEVMAEFRRIGVGRSMLHQLLEEVRPQGAKIVYAATRRGNLIARDWYRSMGFYISGNMYGFYSAEGNVDAVIYARDATKPLG